MKLNFLANIFTIFISDENFFESGAVQTTPIISSYRETTEEAKEFLQKFIEAQTLEEYLDIGDAFDLTAPKQKATFTDFKTYLKEQDPSWKHWK